MRLLFKILFIILLPPFAVAKYGFIAIFISFVLLCFGWWPGVIFAAIVNLNPLTWKLD